MPRASESVQQTIQKIAHRHGRDPGHGVCGRVWDDQQVAVDHGPAGVNHAWDVALGFGFGRGDQRLAELPEDLGRIARVEQDGAKYFGPYSYSHEVREVLDTINRVVPLRTCSDTVFYNRQRPCLEHQIKRCAGPCCLPVDPQEYQVWVRQALSILEGRTGGLVGELTAVMDAAAADLRFEEAAVLRDRIEILKNFGQGQAYSSPGAEDRDVFALYREERLAALSVLNVRCGRISGNRNFSFADVEVSDQEIVESAVEQYYEHGREIPEEIIIPCSLEAESLLRSFLRERRGARVIFTLPRRGLKFRLLNLALLNARQHYLAAFDAESRYRDVAQGLARLLKLEQIPRQVECVDISNFQGSDIVGALVVFYDGQPNKQSYKRYQISFQDKPDDFAAVAEVLRRRLERGRKENDLPDLLIIDGGAGQLGAALKVREELCLNLDIAALAKSRSAGDSQARKPERIFLEGETEELALDPAAPVTHFLERVRNEVHRYVIDYHRRTRSKRVFRSVLDEIPGIGPERKRRLLKEFGSVQKIGKASAGEIARAGRMPLGLAQRVLDGLRK